METIEELVGSRQNVRIMDIAKLAIEELKDPLKIKEFHWDYMKLLRRECNSGKKFPRKDNYRINPETLANLIIANYLTGVDSAVTQLWVDSIPALSHYLS